MNRFHLEIVGVVEFHLLVLVVAALVVSHAFEQEFQKMNFQMN